MQRSPSPLRCAALYTAASAASGHARPRQATPGHASGREEGRGRGGGEWELIAITNYGGMTIY